MTAVFLKILNMGIAASPLILAVIILRFALCKTPKWITCMLWALVAFRLICPFTIESALSLMPHHPTLFETEAGITGPSFPANNKLQIHNAPAGSHLSENGLTDNHSKSGNVETAAAGRPDTKKVVLSLLSMVWITGAAFMAIYNLASYRKLRRRTRASITLYENVLICDGIDVPFVLGMVRPRIYLPSNLAGELAEYVIAHEKAHIARLDHWWKPAGFFILSIYWFHPLCWISYILLCRDIETACDEHVVKTFDFDHKKKYAEALFTYSVKQKMVTACPLPFGETGAAKRIQDVLCYKRPALWVVFGSLAVCIVTAVCFLTDPDSGYQNTGTRADASPELPGNTPFSQPAKGNDSVKASSDDKEGQLQDMLAVWTKAFVDRDGKTVASLASAELIADLKDRELFMGQEGSYSFGMSSPWPLEYRTDCVMLDYDGSQAKIIYYARTSEPHITAWKETLDYEWDGSGYVVTAETLSFHDSISSGAEFKEAYPLLFDGSIMDYTQNGLGESLQENASLSSSNMYRPLFSPESAAVCLLNLSPEDVKITRTGEESPGMVGLNLTFLSDDVTAAISMVRPYGESGIWVPADYKIDVVYRFMNVNWDDVKKIPFTGTAFDDRKNIACIGELPEHDIKVYGYNDDEISCCGVAIDIKGDVNYFDWVYTGPRGILPHLYWDETHGQLQIACNIYTGTGADADILYVLQRYDTGTLVPYDFDFDDYRLEMEKRIGYTFQEESKLLTLVDQQTGKELASAKLPEGNITGIELGLISTFQLGDTITCQVTPGYCTDGSAMAQYDQMPTLEFDVTMQTDQEGNISFGLGNAREKL